MLKEVDIIKLKEDPYKHMNLINFSNDYPISYASWYHDSFIMTGKSDYDWTYLSLNRIEDLKAILKTLQPLPVRWMLQEEKTLEYFKSHYELEWILSCKKLVFKGQVMKESDDLLPLTVEDAAYIQDNNDYGDYTDVAYIKTRIEKGIGLKLVKDDIIIGWILTHDDGAIGFMKVLEDYRNQGYAKLLTQGIINQLHQEGKEAFVHIEKDNIKSLNLAQSSGFEYVGDVHWIKIKE